ncbi:capsid cement protein [Nocardia sp. NPDC050793]|uniref:capsid cement protein n=1 Tax=Nocardia sp. NPDC050793 TaxID=3155159 RepID=UPI0033EADE9F
MANECTPLFRPGKDVTVLTTGAVTGKTFLAISAAPDTYGQLKAATCTAAAKAFGVAARDAASGARVLVIKQGIVPVTAGGTIAVGAEVEVGSSGKAVTLASGKAVGMAVSAGTNNADVLVDLY